MARADIVVVGAGLSGMVAAIGAAERGARVEVVASGHAATHWTSGGIDVAAVPGAATPRDGVGVLARRPDHPYALLAPVVESALDWSRGIAARAGLDYVGDLDSPIVSVPTSIGALRPAAVLPDAQAGALRPWSRERLAVCGPQGFKDFWPDAIAASLRRAAWPRQNRPERIDAVTFPAPGFRGRRNVSALHLAHAFDDPDWRASAFDAMRRGLDVGGGGGGRVLLPACLGLVDHAAAMAEARELLPLDPVEVPLVPPSVPGLRLFAALRSSLRQAGGRIQVGEPVRRVEVRAGRVVSVATAAAARERVIRTDALVLATGGIAGGGIVAGMDGVLRETVLGLPVEAPHQDSWLAADPFDSNGHPLEAAGVRTDTLLRPLAGGGPLPVLENVTVVGSLLAGQRYLRERCGDGVALASGRLAALMLTSRDRVARERALIGTPA